MPLYSYACQTCEKNFDLRHSHKETNIACPLCKSPKIIKNLSHNVYRPAKIAHRTLAPGAAVEEAIEDNRQQLARAKKQLIKQNRTKE